MRHLIFTIELELDSNNMCDNLIMNKAKIIIIIIGIVEKVYDIFHNELLNLDAIKTSNLMLRNIIKIKYQ